MRAYRPPLFLLLCLPVACGGEAFTTSDGDGTGGSVASGGNGTGAGNGSGGDNGTGGATETGGGPGTGGATETGGSGGGSNVDTSCSATIQCTAVENRCCSYCQPPTLEQMQALRVDQLDNYSQELCGDDPVSCPPCAPQRNPHLFAECVRGTCEVQDLRTHDNAACTDTSDCIVSPAACCNCNAGNGPEDIVALNSDASDFFEAQCATATTPICGDCLWSPPPGVTAACVDGFCSLLGL